jgi:glycosyltransferase involved in cell wall biosynthesis
MFPTRDNYNIAAIKKQLNLPQKVLLFFGYIRDYKGLKFLLRAMPEIIKQHPNLKLLVVGEFWAKDKQDYFELIQKLNIQENLVLINEYVPNEEVGKYFAVSDVVVLPYVTATQSAAVQTAYAFDKPVLSTAVGGLKDSVIPGQTGYFIEPENAADIAEKVNHFYQNPIPPAKVKAQKHLFSWEKYLEFIQ